MSIEVRKTLGWGTAAAAIASAALLASVGGGGPRVAGLAPAAGSSGPVNAPVGVDPRRTATTGLSDHGTPAGPGH